jgi:hypothetical protein
MRLVNPVRKQQAGITGNAQLICDTLVIPEGFEMIGLDILQSITPTGSAGTGTSVSSTVIKSIQIVNEMGEVVANFGTGLAVALAGAASGLKYYDSDASPSASPAVTDQDGVLAGNAAVLSFYRIIANLKGKAYKVVINYFLPTLAGYTTQPTSYTASVNVVLLVVPLARAIEPECKLAAMEIDTNTRFDFSDQSVGSLFHDAVLLSTTQLDTTLTGLNLGENSYNAEQIADLEQSTTQDNALTGVAASGGTYFAAHVQAARRGLLKAASSASMSIIAIAKDYER